MNRRALWLGLALAGLLAVAAGGFAWSTAAGPGPADNRVASLDPDAGVVAGKKKRKDRKADAPKARKAEARPKDPARPKDGARRKDKAAKAPQLDGEDRALARTEFRDERLLDANERLDAHAAKAGWDPERTEEVREILIDTADHVTATLTGIDQGTAEWEQVKAELREYRLAQADKVRALVGDREFDAFVVGMGFERFFGEEPVRGRLK